MKRKDIGGEEIDNNKGVQKTRKEEVIKNNIRKGEIGKGNI